MLRVKLLLERRLSSLFGLMLESMLGTWSLFYYYSSSCYLLMVMTSLW